MSARVEAQAEAYEEAYPETSFRQGVAVVGIDPLTQSPTGAWDRSSVVLDTGGVNPWTNLGSQSNWTQPTPGKRAQQTAFGVLADGVDDTFQTVDPGNDFFNSSAWAMIFRVRMGTNTNGRLYESSGQILSIVRSGEVWFLRVNANNLLNGGSFPFADTQFVMARGDGVVGELNVGNADPGDWQSAAQGPLNSITGAPKLFSRLETSDNINAEISQHYLFDQSLDRTTMEQMALFIEAVNP